MKTMTNGLQSWLQKNSWSLLVTASAVIIAFTTLNNKVNAISENNVTLEGRLDRIESLTERLIVLEEHDKSIVEDIGELKQDVKDLKTHFNLR